MTLQKFSDKSFRSMFLNRLKSALLFPVIGLAVLCIFAVILPFSEVVRLNNPDAYSSAYMQISIDNVKYILFDSLTVTNEYFPHRAVIMYMAVIIAAILCAVMVFRDLSNKKTANVYYSLGFSRSKLFALTYLAGAVSVLGMVVIPFALSLIINLFSFGFSKELFSACIFVVSCLANVSLLAYTISAIAMTLTGMLFEGIFFSFFLNFVSPVFTFASCMFSDGLLTGGGFVDANEYYYSTFENSFMSAFLGKLSYLNGLSHSAYEVDRLGCCLYTAEIEGLNNFLATENWRTPDFVPLLVWSFILTGAIFLGFCVFNRKKTENIGFFASSPVLYRLFFGTLIVGFSSLACMNGRTITKGLTWLYILISLAICLVITTIFALILTRLSRMKFKKEFKVFGIYSLAVILFAAVFSTGFFGYQNRIPAAEKVEKVTITSYRTEWENFYNTPISGEYGDFAAITMGNFAPDGTYTFNQKADITNIGEIHKALISADNSKLSENYSKTKIGTKINIVYDLKNGKTISRFYYKITPEIIDRYLTYNGISETVNENLVKELEMAISYAGDTEFIDGYELDSYYTVFSNDLTKATNVDLSPEQLVGLLNAYRLDAEKLSAKELLAPKCKALGGIAIRKDGVEYGEWDEKLGKENVLGIESETSYSSLKYYTFENSVQNIFVTINENMTNTVKWAKDVGIYKYFAKNYETKIQYIEATYNNSSSIKLALSDNRNYNLLFEGRCIKMEYETMITNDDSSSLLAIGVSLYGSHRMHNLTQEEIKFLRDNASPFYLTVKPGYFLRISTNEEIPCNSVLFIPESKLTPELKVKLAEISAVETEDTSNYIEGTTSHAVY